MLAAAIRALQEEVARLRGAPSKKRRREDVSELSGHSSESADASRVVNSDSERDSDLQSEDEAHVKKEEEEEEEEPRLSRAPPPLSQETLEEITLGRVGSFLADAEDIRTKLYSKKWKAPASLLVEAKDQPAPKAHHWILPGKEASSLQRAETFNKVEGVVIHSRHLLSFGSETVAAQLRESPLLSEEEREYLRTGLETEQARDNELFWRAIRLHQEATLTEAKLLDMANCLQGVRLNHPDWWAQIRQEHSAAHPGEPCELGTTLPAQQAARMKGIAGSTVALFMETLKQGFRKAHLYAAKALGISPATLGSSLPRHEITVCNPSMVAEAQARAAALPYLERLPQQQGGTDRRGKRAREPRRKPTARKGKALRERARKRRAYSGNPHPEPPADSESDRSLPQPTRGPQKHRPQQASHKHKKTPGGGQQKRTKRE